MSTYRVVNLSHIKELAPSDSQDMYDNYSYNVNRPVNVTLKIPGKVLPNEPYTLFQAMVNPYSSENACVIIIHSTKKAYNFYEYFKYLNPTNSIGNTDPMILKPDHLLFTDSKYIADQINKSGALQRRYEDISQISEISIDKNNIVTITMRKRLYGSVPTTVRIKNKTHRLYVKHNKEFITLKQALAQFGTK